MKNLVVGLAMGLGLVTTSLHAQSVSENLSFIESVAPMSAENAPAIGTFYSAQHAPGTAHAWPPLPANVYGLPVWDLGSNVFLLSDEDVDYNAVQTMSRMSIDSMSLDFEGESMMSMSSSLSDPVDFGTNLWLQITSLSGSTANLLLSNTIPSVQYEIQGISDLADTNWLSEGFCFGAELTNWTAATADASAFPNHFYRARSWEDSDGNGIADWWELQNFGTVGINPFADADGDGYNNLQEYHNKTNPNYFDTPAALSVWISYGPNAIATVNWLPASGAVTGYTLIRSYYPYGITFPPEYAYSESQTNMLSSATNSFSEDLASFNPYFALGPLPYVSYTIQANYSSGNSLKNTAWVSYANHAAGSGAIPMNALAAYFINNGSDSNAILVIPQIPTDTTSFLLSRIVSDDYYTAYIDATHLISVTNVNQGVFSLPASWQFGDDPNPLYIQWWLQTVNANGETNQVTIIQGGWPLPFYDGRMHLKQNLVFQLRVANSFNQFNFYNFQIDDSTIEDALVAYPQDYVFSGFYNINNYHRIYGTGPTDLPNLNILLPFEDNTLYRNYVYSTSDINANGDMTTGATTYLSDGTNVNLQFPSSYMPNTSHPTNSLLSSSATQWLCMYPIYLWDDNDRNAAMGFAFSSWSLPTWTLVGGAKNYWGLPYVSAKFFYSNDGTNWLSTVLSPNDSVSTESPGAVYMEAAQPQFQTMEYDFWIPNSGYWDDSEEEWHQRDYLPGQPGFSPNQASDNRIITSVGSSINVAGYAKLAVTNGYENVYGYLGQYFDKAYKMTNGVRTSIETGILSPYGAFYATEPGAAALVTMADPVTSERGTGTVYCISLNVDKNHNGEMDLNFSSPDATSQSSPMRVWVNNGYIKPGSSGELDQDLPLPNNDLKNANYAQGKITCQRDLENFFRLWICGLPSLPSSQGYYVTLACGAVSGSPAINLYYAETNGGIGYLTDTNVAQSLVNASSLGRVSPTNTLLFPPDFFDGTNKYFMFEGAGIGIGQFVLTVYKNNSYNAIAQASIYLDLHDIKDFYQRVKATPRDPNGIPAPFNSMTAFDEQTAGVDVSGDGQFNPPNDETKTATVFVHGSNLSVDNAIANGDTMFKRLYWQGYSGRFVLFYWNTLVGPFDGYIPAHYNYNEFRAFKYGLALKYFVENDLSTNFAKNIIAHSMGNMVVASALYPRGTNAGMTCRNVILMQAAVPASCFDPNAATLDQLANLESPQKTPDYYTQNGYRGLVATNVNATICNIYNTNDFALGWWINNQELCKPENLSYPVPRNMDVYYDWTMAGGTLREIGSGNLIRNVTDPQESMSFIARSRTEAVGRMATGGSIFENKNVGRGTDFPVPFLNGREDHSGEFTRPIQQLNSFYNYLYLRVR